MTPRSGLRIKTVVGTFVLESGRLPHAGGGRRHLGQAVTDKEYAADIEE